MFTDSIGSNIDLIILKVYESRTVINTHKNDIGYKCFLYNWMRNTILLMTIAKDKYWILFNTKGTKLINYIYNQDWLALPNWTALSYTGRSFLLLLTPCPSTAN